jgi:hypothetical protein
MRQPNATIRLDEALGDLQNRLSRVDDAEKDRLISALGGPLVAKIPQVLWPIPANNMLLAVPLFLDILRSGRVGQIDGMIDGAPGTAPRDWLPLLEFTDVGALCRLPDGREIQVTEGRIDRQAWKYLFSPAPPLSETSEPRSRVSSADLVKAGWITEEQALQRDIKDGLITEDQARAFKAERSLAALRQLRDGANVSGEPAPDAPGAPPPASPTDPESEPPSVVEGATNEPIVADNLPAEAMPLAEWIFAQHPRDGSKTQARNQLLLEARKSLPVFTRDNFYLAYRCVYETKIGQPPAAGWPLRKPYRSLLAEEQNKSSK